MSKFLANENVPGDVIEAARQDGFDLAWIAEFSPGANDDTVLATSIRDDRVLITFDKDFGEMAFRQGKNASCGIILFRPRLGEPDYLVRFTRAVLSQNIKWEGQFTVVQEGKMRIVPLPT